MPIMRGFQRFIKAMLFALCVVFVSVNAWADVTILTWTATVDGGTVSGVARCGPNSDGTKQVLKKFSTQNWGAQNRGCYCRVRDIDSVSDWNLLDNQNPAFSYWYGSGTQSTTNSLCLEECADVCKNAFESSTTYQ